MLEVRRIEEKHSLFQECRTFLLCRCHTESLEILLILLPFYLVRPVGSGELAFGDILCMTGLKRSAAGCVGSGLSLLARGAFDTLLPESNCLDLFTDLGYDNMRLLWMVWRSLWFVVA